MPGDSDSADCPWQVDGLEMPVEERLARPIHAGATYTPQELYLRIVWLEQTRIIL